MPEPHTTTMTREEVIKNIRDADGKGFDQAKRNLSNPHIKGAHEYLAYEYGKKVANEQA